MTQYPEQFPTNLQSLQDTVLNLFDIIMPVNETCKTLHQISLDKRNNPSLYIVCLIMMLSGLNIAFTGHKYELISIATIIFFGVTLGGTHILKSVFSLTLDALKDFHKDKPYIYFSIQFLLAIIAAFLIQYFILPFIKQAAVVFILFHIFRKAETAGWIKTLPETGRFLYVIVIFFMLGILIYALISYSYKMCLIALFSIYGVLYTFMGFSTFVFIYSEGKHLYSPLDIRSSVMNEASIIIVCSIIVCFLYQLFVPKKKRS
ncbi:hypothetical protein CDIK_0776 [Cucumispora dikerogammari]|nr:hypothetical protein CDIK_0776 [Cucumispora dikerogammari]